MKSKIIILGPPLSGKGTQGQLLAERFGLPRLSVGALIRRLYKEHDKLGINAAKYMLKGEAVPGTLLIAILISWFEKHKNGFVVDNLIRSEDQLKAFEKYSQKNNFVIDKVIYLTISKQEILKRFYTRIAEHAKSNRVREDETVDRLLTRIKVYNLYKHIILNYFRKQNTVARVSGNHSVSKVHEDILELFNLKMNGYD